MLKKYISQYGFALRCLVSLRHFPKIAIMIKKKKNTIRQYFEWKYYARALHSIENVPNSFILLQ